MHGRTKFPEEKRFDELLQKVWRSVKTSAADGTEDPAASAARKRLESLGYLGNDAPKNR